MKVLMGLLGAVSFLAGANSAFGDAACQKCTHEIQVQYRNCLRIGKDQATCGKEEQAAAQACVTICNPKSSDPASQRTPPGFS
jgi:hypothetical protein